MFCSQCGKELPDGSNFCPSCGNKIGGSSVGTKQKFKQASDLVSSTAKNAGQRINDATDGKAGEFAQNVQTKAKETAKNFSYDVKKAIKEKDAKGFFTRNKYRNTLIIVIAIAIVVSLIGFSTSYIINRKYTKLADYDTEHSFEGKKVHSKVIGKSKTRVYVLSTCKKNNVSYEVLWIYEKDTLKNIGDGQYDTKDSNADWKSLVNGWIENDNLLADLMEEDDDESNQVENDDAYEMSDETNETEVDEFGTNSEVENSDDDDDLEDEVFKIPDTDPAVFGFWDNEGLSHSISFNLVTDGGFTISIGQQNSRVIYLLGIYSENSDGTYTATVTEDSYNSDVGKQFTVVPTTEGVQIISSDVSFQEITGEYPYVGAGHMDLEELNPNPRNDN